MLACCVREMQHMSLWLPDLNSASTHTDTNPRSCPASARYSSSPPPDITRPLCSFCCLCLTHFALHLARVEATDVRFRKAWDSQLQKKGAKKASLFAACASAVGPLFLSALPFKLLNDASQFVGPVILNQLLTAVAGKATQNAAAAATAAAAVTAAAGGFNNATTMAAAAGGMSASASAATASGWEQWLQWLEAPLSNGYCLAFLLFFGTTLGVLADNQHFQRVMRAGFRLKAIVTAEVYRKVVGFGSLEGGRGGCLGARCVLLGVVFCQL